MTRPNSLPLLPPWGVQSCFFCFLVRCWWFEGLAKQHKSEGPRPNSFCQFPSLNNSKYWTNFFKWELFKWRLGWSDQGEEYTCQIQVQLSKNAASSQDNFLSYRTTFCCFAVRSTRAFFNSAHDFNILHFWTGCSLSIILQILCRNIGFSLKRGLHIWKCTLHSFKWPGATFQAVLHGLIEYCHCKNTLHCLKGRLLLFRRVYLFWLLHLLAGMEIL